MKAGGVLVLYAACRDGLGTRDMAVPFEGARSVAEVIERLKGDYRIQMDHALLLGKILQRDIRIVVATRNVETTVLRTMFLHASSSPQEAAEKAVAMTGKPKPTVAFFPQAQRALSILDTSLRTI
jgi:nickel-dependent lactate racemase